jgi:hypothetical protein
MQLSGAAYQSTAFPIQVLGTAQSRAASRSKQGVCGVQLQGVFFKGFMGFSIVEQARQLQEDLAMVNGRGGGGASAPPLAFAPLPCW